VNNVVVNRTTTVNVTNINVYNNVHVHNAVVGVSEDRFGRGAVQTARVDDARVRDLTPIRGAPDVKPVAASVMSADRAALRPPAAIRDRNVVATRTPRDFSPSLRAQGLSADREAAPAAAPRIVPAPKRTVAATPPAEGPGPSQRPRQGETPNARRPDPSSAPSPGARAPRPGSREGASVQPDSRQPDSKQGQRPQADENERGRKLNPPPPPPAHNSAESRHGRPQGPEQRRRPEAKQGQPSPRSSERPPEKTERPPEK
jgi:translation initiation factor IF-2